MQLPMRLLAFILGAFVAGATFGSVTPLQKVVTMLMGMLEKGKKEKHQEQVQFAAYSQFCQDTSITLKKQIKEGTSKVSMLKADIQKYVTESNNLARDVQELESNIAVFSGDQRASTRVRELEQNAYTKTHKDYTESIDAIGKAVAVLKKENYDRRQSKAKGLLQQVVSFDKVPEASKRTIEAFLAFDSEESNEKVVAPPQAYGYEFQSNGIVDMLGKLGDKFVDERSALEKAEINSRHAFGLLQQDLKSEISNAKATITTKSQNRAKDLTLVAARKGDLQDAASSLQDDKKYLGGLTSSCDLKSKDYKSRQTLRTNEIVAIEKAVEIISSGRVQGAASKAVTLAQLSSKGTSLAQLRSSPVMSMVATKSTNQIRVAAYLNIQGKKVGSRVLTMLAARAAADPFNKVKKMIKDLMTRLEQQQNEEATHKSWCDTELKENGAVRASKTASVDDMKSEIDELSASVAKAGAEIVILHKQIVDLDANMAKETSIRQKDKADNMDTIKDAKDAQAAVEKAVLVLKEFYAAAADSTALFQESQHIAEAPEVFDGAYKGQESGGVVGMLEVIQSNFARLKSDSTAAEFSQAKAHDKFMTESKVAKAQKKSDITHKSNQKQRQEQQLANKKNDLIDETKELNAANKYFEKLKPSCLDAGMSYQERVARREEEIKSLQEALKIISGEDIALLETA